MQRFALLIAFTLSTSFHTLAQHNWANTQSPPQNWSTVENEFVQVIYPTGFKDNAIYMANLMEHYSKYVGLSYGLQKPKQVSLIYRPQMGDPNGFVTLAPRRTEWFDSTNFFAHVSTVEWHENLSIHEYRHIIQQDIFNKKTVKAFDVLMGDSGQAILSYVARKPWYMEGDAVYAETKYTQSGRGRSSRFMARLKAILLKGETPTYDQFVNGTYNDQLVSWYIYGYVLISHGYKKYGDNFWDVVMDNVTARPYPNGIVGAIENASGVDFYDFYYEAFEELRKKWKKDSFPELKTTEFKIKTNQFKNGDDLYYLEYDLNSFYRLIRESNGEKEVLTDIPYSEDLTRLDYSKTHAIQSHFLPHWRYGFKSYSDLSLIDLKDGSKKYITSGQRLYNPHFNKAGDKITAINFDSKNKWLVQEIDLAGNMLRHIKNEKYKFLEAVAINSNEVIALVTVDTGGKGIVKANFETQQVTPLIPISFNNLYWLQSDFKNNILFEGQYNGAVEVFKFNFDTNSLAKCTTSKIATYAPTMTNGEILFSEQTINGKRISKVTTDNCQSIPISYLTDPNKYYSKDSPSDRLNNFERVDFKDRKEVATKNYEQYKEKDYSGFDWRAFTPHSWSFFVGQGYGLSLWADNYLRDFGWNVNLGYEAAENTPYSSLQIDFKRYWPIFSLLADLREREVSRLGTDNDDYGWDENAVGAQVQLPFVSRHNLYNLNITLGYSAEYVQTKDYNSNDIDISGEADLIRQTTSLNIELYKDFTARSIISPWSFSLLGMYQDASTDDTTGLVGDYRWFGDITLTTPGLFRNNGFKFSVTGEEYGNGTSYRFQPTSQEIMGYVFSRGYDYFASKRYIKTSSNYLFPLFYPDYNIAALIYFKRIYMNLFYDNTKVYPISADNGFHISSYGAELVFNTSIFRAIPVDFGYRFVRTHETEESINEVFLGIGLTF
ncbi:hypothetical protein ABMA77_01935 [Halobacteriovorax sp. RZ-1]|uniref:hypothetical protein n=1 Tax=unclassified Halobacteriovorax TaxID=2639665 RepID=UPI003723CC95